MDHEIVMTYVISVYLFLWVLAAAIFFKVKVNKDLKKWEAEEKDKEA